MSLVDHPLYRLRAKMLLAKQARNGSAEAQAVLDDGDMSEFFVHGLPDAMGADPVPSGHPILDQIAALIQKIIANPQGLIAFIQLIITLFPK